jgi:O-antigen ligase
VLYRFGFYLLIVSSPLFLGSNRPLFWGINGVLSALVMMGYVGSEIKKESSRFDWKLPFIATFCFLLIGMWMAIQASPWTPKAWHHPIWFASPMLAKARSTISADPSQTWDALGWWSTLSVFMVAVQLGTNVRRSMLLQLMLSVCIFVALFGFVVEFFELNTLGVIAKTYYKGWLTGTFVNRNSAASFIGIGLIIALSMATHEHLVHLRRNARPLGVFLANTGMSRFKLYAVLGLFLFGALLLTGSRGGIATAIAGCFLLLVMEAVKQKRLNAQTLVALLGGFVVSAALATSIILSYRTQSGMTASTEVRYSLFAEALRAVADRPIFGHGAGTYSSIQPLYHSASTPPNFVWDNAHSTLLEGLVTLGLPVMIFAIVISAYIFLQLAKAWWNTRSEATCLRTAIAVSVAVTLHAFVDFSLEIQAIALYVACLVGLGMGELMSLRSMISEQDQFRSYKPTVNKAVSEP